MKFLPVLAVIVVAVWVWRNNRQAELRPPSHDQPSPVTAMAVVACQHCGTHLPESEAVLGRRGSYCCVEHRQQHESASA
ncbi:MAG: PP0621 family protein [Burkholderiaceae bacterium]